MTHQSATATHHLVLSSHTTQQPRLTAGVCWKMLSQGAGVLPLVLGVLSVQDKMSQKNVPDGGFSTGISRRLV
jgi:hypothetical protein